MTLTAVQKELAWLAAYNPSDGLPGLLVANGGPFKDVQAYWRRQPNLNQPSLYLIRRTAHEERSANLRVIRSHRFIARIVWPLATSSSAEGAQASLDAAVDLVLLRIRDYTGNPTTDHTHGGAFLSVAEGISPVDNSALIDVEFTDPEHAIASKQPLRCDITYHADDLEVIS